MSVMRRKKVGESERGSRAGRAAHSKMLRVGTTLSGSAVLNILFCCALAGILLAWIYKPVDAASWGGKRNVRADQSDEVDASVVWYGEGNASADWNSEGDISVAWNSEGGAPAARNSEGDVSAAWNSEGDASADWIGEGDASPDSDGTSERTQHSETEPAGTETEAAEEPEDKRIALTFDDGPHPIYTKTLLDGLAERGVCATFFVIGKNIPGNEELIARMDAEGHLIGNHTYDHVKISDLSVEEACEQVEKTSALVKAITGKNTEFVRPPFGAWKKEMECSFVMIPVLWDVDPLDWTTCNVSDVVRRVLEAVEPGDIILLHDCYESSVEAALQIVDTLTEQGYVFVTVDELILE